MTHNTCVRLSLKDGLQQGKATRREASWELPQSSRGKMTMAYRDPVVDDDDLLIDFGSGLADGCW